MTLELSLRLITPCDNIADLTELLHRAYRPLAEAGMHFLAAAQDEEATRRRIRNAECWLAILDGAVAGTIALHFPSRGHYPWYMRPDVAVFGQFAVEPSCQARGIGSRLLDHVEQRAKELGAGKLACDTAEPAHHLIAFYNRRGYRFVEFAQGKDVNYRSVILSKDL